MYPVVNTAEYTYAVMRLGLINTRSDHDLKSVVSTESYVYHDWYTSGINANLRLFLNISAVNTVNVVPGHRCAIFQIFQIGRTSLAL